MEQAPGGNEGATGPDGERSPQTRNTRGSHVVPGPLRNPTRQGRVALRTSVNLIISKIPIPARQGEFRTGERGAVSRRRRYRSSRSPAPGGFPRRDAGGGGPGSARPRP